MNGWNRRQFLAASAGPWCAGCEPGPKLRTGGKPSPSVAAIWSLAARRRARATRSIRALASAEYMSAIEGQLYDTLTFVNEKVATETLPRRKLVAQARRQGMGVQAARGVTFHNGKSLTPEDVVYSINHHRRQGFRSRWRAR